MMGKRIKQFAAVVAGLAMLASLAACSALDVVGKDSVRAFGDVLDALPADEYEPNRWKLTAPDGSAWFLFDNTGIDMVVDTAPFVAAGADLSKLENATEHNINPGKVSITFASPGLDMLNQNVKDTALEQFRFDIDSLRDDLGYHSLLDHYNLSFGDGNMFEWAKDMKQSGYDKSDQDKDIVFVLNPEPFIAAGLDPEKVEGWTYAQVPIEKNGKTDQVWKLLKPFNLK